MNSNNAWNLEIQNTLSGIHNMIVQKNTNE